MKQLFALTLFALTLSSTAWCQEKTMELRFRAGGAATFLLHSHNDSKYSSDTYGGLQPSFNFGIEASHFFSANKELLFGVQYARVSGREQRSKDYLVAAPGQFSPNHSFSGEKLVFHALTVPVQYRYSFKKYFYVDGGIFLDVTTAKEQTTGVTVGPGVGVGIRYPLSKEFSISFYPNGRLTFWGGTRAMLQGNIELNVAYRIPFKIQRLSEK
ncbi:MAG: hypothetical protein LBM62_06890 [Mediterranea sp.]|jgi:hypothetical protein|nr:hypothetical protein [Mediterranea sp.]